MLVNGDQSTNHRRVNTSISAVQAIFLYDYFDLYCLFMILLFYHYYGYNIIDYFALCFFMSYYYDAMMMKSKAE